MSASLLAPFRCRGPYDLIFAYEPSPITVGLPAIVLKKLKRVPVMFWVQDLWPESLSATGAVRSELLLRGVAKLVCFIYWRREAHERPEGMEEAAVMMTGLERERVLQGLAILAEQPRGKDCMLKVVQDYDIPNVSQKVLRIISDTLIVLTALFGINDWSDG